MIWLSPRPQNPPPLSQAQQCWMAFGLLLWTDANSPLLSFNHLMWHRVIGAESLTTMLLLLCLHAWNDFINFMSPWWLDGVRLSPSLIKDTCRPLNSVCVQVFRFCCFGKTEQEAQTEEKQSEAQTEENRTARPRTPDRATATLSCGECSLYFLMKIYNLTRQKLLFMISLFTWRFYLYLMLPMAKLKYNKLKISMIKLKFHMQLKIETRMNESTKESE